MHIDPEDNELVKFWKEFNPDLYAMVEASKFKTGDRCDLNLHKAIALYILFSFIDPELLGEHP